MQPGSGGEGYLYVQGRRDKQELPRLGMAGRDVLAYPEPGRTTCNITLLRTL